MTLKKSETFDRERKRAQIMEMDCSCWLKRLGYRILPTYDYSGLQDNKSPKLEAADVMESLVVPDLLGVRDGRCRWFEVKLKAEATYHRNSRTLTTGIGKRLWRHYWKVQQEGGLPVFVVFIHEKENEVRAAALEALGAIINHEYDGDKMDRGGMVFFRYEDIPVISTHEEFKAISRNAEAQRRVG